MTTTSASDPSLTARTAAVGEPPSGGDGRGLVVDGLAVTFDTGGQSVPAVRGVSFGIEAGQTLALVGESGSGKSVVARTIIGLTGGRSTVAVRELSFDGQDLTALREAQWRTVRGGRIALILQDALVSLDPMRTIAAEITEVLRLHRTVRRDQYDERVRQLLTDVGIPDPRRRARQRPHELSGGLRQRALIAAALAAGPRLLIADEPTTALDVTLQVQVLDLLGRLTDTGVSLLLISHDLTVVARLADRIAVMYAGRIVEHGPADQVLGDARHPYTRALLGAVPSARTRGTRLSVGRATDLTLTGPGCPYAARCPAADDHCGTHEPALTEIAPGQSVACWHPTPGTAHPPLVGLPAPAVPAAVAATVPRPVPAGEEPLLRADGLGRRFRSPDGTWQSAARDVTFELRAGQTLGIVGESGSGKTTTARIVLGALRPDEGTVHFAGRLWNGPDVAESARRAHRRRIQAVHQDPLSSFDPRFTVARLVAEAVAVAGVPRGAARRARVVELLDTVGLSARLLERRPLELSGGQRQRVALARAMAPGPDLLVCDEPVSALDVSIQAQILDLLADLQAEFGLALLFISHDLGVIGHVSEHILVMRGGLVVEAGPAEGLLAAPAHDYTRELLAAGTLR
ncbi:ABC transporter ATP-binding protein [Frankia sp. Ag45/Mut15]|uniref:ABC transporter ATP-binding protein n=1 Tax=Frankia umida TaxID=573489 RepID=A0ABT0K493_9ACTN|nr:ABC transporter ATP-binding protein [Frankia umida]MCK9878610.1 ABC transporter ATP-binding protein [Frankia umida]